MSDQVKIDFTTGYDGKGAEQAALGIDKVKEASAKTQRQLMQDILLGKNATEQAAEGIRKVKGEADKATGGFKEFKKSVSAVNEGMEAIGKVTRGLGIVAVIGGVIASIQNIKKYFDDAAAAARKIKLDAVSKENEIAVNGLTKEYEALLRAVEAANIAILRQRELEDARTKNKRDMQDVQDAMDQQNELDKLDRKDPLYKEKTGEINAKYKSIAVMRQSGREDEDLQTKMQLEGDKIKDLRSKEMAARSGAEGKWSEYARQQKQISELESPVIKTRGVYKSAGAFGAVKVGEEQYEDDAATKQNREKAKEMAGSENFKDLAIKARELVRQADEYGKQAAHSANMADAFSKARTVSLAKAGNDAAAATSGREASYFATDTAQEALNKQREEQRKKDEEDQYQKKAIPLVQQKKADFEAAQRKEAEARIEEQQAATEVDSRKQAFRDGGSRNTTQFKKTIDPYEALARQKKDAHDLAERYLAIAKQGFDEIASVYGEGLAQVLKEAKQNAMRSKIDATGN